MSPSWSQDPRMIPYTRVVTRTLRGLALFVGTLLGSACSPAPPSALPVPDHIVLVTIDTLRADHLSWQGYPLETTPFLSQFAADGVVFRNAFSASSHTAPSHASLFTGLHPYQHGVIENGGQLDSRFQTLAAVFRRAGYETAGFTGVGFLDGLRPGFETLTAVSATKEGPRGGYVVLGHAQRWLAERPRDAKFFLWVHFYDVHEWRHQLARYQNVREQFREGSEMDARETLAWVQTHHRVSASSFSESDLDPALSLLRYDSQILYVDRLVSYLSRTLERRFDGTTLWIVTSDHGEGLGSHDYLGHGRFLYQEQLHVPLLFHFTTEDSAPAPWRGRVVDETVRLVDLLGTLDEVVASRAPGDEPRKGIPPDGRSLVPLLLGQSDGPPRPPSFAQRRPVKTIWSEPKERLYSLHDHASKLIVSDSGREEFYDLIQDSGETSNLEGPSESRARLSEELRRRMQEMETSEDRDSNFHFDPRHEAELRALGYLE
ncbi:sulfatase [Myxococcota bacterium]|nr:sulfatase [Myxococcota bacterium]